MSWSCRDFGSSLSERIEVVEPQAAVGSLHDPQAAFGSGRELRQIMESMHVEVFRISDTLRSVIHDELEQFFKQMVEQRPTLQLPLRAPVASAENNIKEFCEQPVRGPSKSILRGAKSSVDFPDEESAQGEVNVASSVNSQLREPLLAKSRIGAAELATSPRPLKRSSKRMETDMSNRSVSFAEGAETEGASLNSGSPHDQSGSDGGRTDTSPSDASDDDVREISCRALPSGPHSKIEKKLCEISNFDSEASEALGVSLTDRKRCIMTGREYCNTEETLRLRLTQAKLDQSYNVEDFYHRTGCCQALARQDSWFSTVSLVVVTVNVLWIGVDTDIDRQDILIKAPVISQVMDNLFCSWFVLELVVRFMSFSRKRSACRDPMFLFDTLLVIFMVWETWIEVILYLTFDIARTGSSNVVVAQLFRCFRLVRLTRIPRVLRLSLAVPELMILIKGVGQAMRSVFAILLLLLFTVFIFGILFTELLRDNASFTDDFASVPRSMNTLFLQVLCGIDPAFLNNLLELSVAYYMLYLVYLFLGLLTFMNMLIGVLCDVVSSVSEEEKDNMRKEQLEYELAIISEKVDLNRDGSISKYEFEQLMSSNEVLKHLDNLGVDVVAFGGLSSFIFCGEAYLTLSEFCTLIAQFRGCRQATMKDLVDMRMFFTMEMDRFMTEIRQLHRSESGRSPQHGLDPI